MNIIICVDNNYGMMFNDRRQSQDAAVIKDMVNTFGEGRIYINSFSQKLFEGYNVKCSEDFLERAGEDDYCFIENVDVDEIMDKVKKIVLYKWHRDYPSDTYFDNDHLYHYYLDDSVSFPGNSHDKIERVVYSK